jgi:hypothetical protein
MAGGGARRALKEVLLGVHRSKAVRASSARRGMFLLRLGCRLPTVVRFLQQRRRARKL